MKIIQTYWSKPISENRVNGGWLSEKYHYLSWALSCLKLKQYYKEVELYTDLQGKELLIDRLQLPYSKVHICMDDIKYVPSPMWAMSKIYTYSLQKTPFIHVDGDVYIWSRFSKELENASLISQNIEKYNSYYKSSLQYGKGQNLIFPEVFEISNLHEGISYAVNAGIIGGNEIDFFKDYSKMAFDFLHSNIKKLEKRGSEKLNVLVEQFLFFQLAKRKNIEIKCLFDEVNADFSDLREFAMVPKYRNYIHLIGLAKQSEFACNMVERFLQLEFPGYYNFFKNSFIDNDQAQRNYVPNVKLNLNKTFDYSFSYAYKFQSSFTVSSLETINLQQQAIGKLKEKVTNENQEFINELTQFVNVQSSLLEEDVKTIGDSLTFIHFKKNRHFLENHNQSQILEMKYILSDSIEVVVFNYDFQTIIADNNLFDISMDGIERQKCFYVFMKQSDDTVKYYRLNDFDCQLLYYLNLQEMSGNELVDAMLNDETIKEILEKDVYKSIADHLLCTSFVFLSKS